MLKVCSILDKIKDQEIEKKLEIESIIGCRQQGKKAYSQTQSYIVTQVEKEKNGGPGRTRELQEAGMGHNTQTLSE